MDNTWKNNGKIVKHNSTGDIEELIERINQLPPEQKVELVQSLIGKDAGLTVVFGTNNVVSNSVSIQLGNLENVDEVLKNMSQEAVCNLLLALSHRISQIKR